MADTFGDAWAALGRVGALQVGFPEECGGSGGGLADAAEALWAYMADGGAPGVGTAWAVHHGAGVRLIADFGDEAQRRRFLPEFAGGAGLCAYAMTEVDAEGRRRPFPVTRAEFDIAGFRIYGDKAFVTNGPSATHVIVMAKRPQDAAPEDVTAFIVDLTESAEGRRWEPLAIPGLQADDPMSPGHASFHFEGCVVPFDNIIPPPGDGRRVLAPWAMTGERALFYAVAVGGLAHIVTSHAEFAQAHALREACTYARRLVMEHAALCVPGKRGDARRYAVLARLADTLDTLWADVWAVAAQVDVAPPAAARLKQYHALSKVPAHVRARAATELS